MAFFYMIKEIKALFDISSIPEGEILSATPDIANTWRVKFNTENVAVRALENSREKKLGETVVSAYLKSENISKLLFVPVI